MFWFSVGSFGSLLDAFTLTPTVLILVEAHTHLNSILGAKKNCVTQSDEIK